MGEPAAVEHLDPSQCWALLRTQRVGRVAFLAEDGIVLLPVNFVVDGGSIVFRTAAGSKLEAATKRVDAAFEVDGTSEDAAVAWSVVLRGSLAPILGLHEVLDTFALPLHPFETSEKNSFVRLHAQSVTGRRFPIVDASRWGAPAATDDRRSDAVE